MTKVKMNQVYKPFGKGTKLSWAQACRLMNKNQLVTARPLPYGCPMRTNQ